ncbi:DUF7619 domain-containing protein [Flavobacterium sp.]
MKKLYTLLVLLVGSITIQAQIVNISDANFKARLLQEEVAFDENFVPITIDTNSNGEIEVNEIQNVYALDVSNSNIANLAGIEFFTALKSLNCSHNLLTTLSINNGISFSGLDASYNMLTYINVTFDPIVEGLWLGHNNLTSFVAENSYFADTFDLSNNQLINLVVNNATFDYFNVSFNSLTSIEIQGNVSFYNTILLSNNQFSDLDFTGVYLDYDSTLYLGNNPVDKVPTGAYPGNIFYSSNNTSFDLGSYSAFTSCDPDDVGNVTITNSPNLQTIILKNGFSHTEITCNEGGTVFQNPAISLNITNCPNLSFICVDEGEQPFIQARINQLGLQNQVQVNSYCSFVPGGTFYAIQGTTRLDGNNNGCDTSDAIFPNLNFSISNGTTSGTLISNTSGAYSIPVQEGTQTITPVFENPSYFTVSPTSATVIFPAAASPFTQDFCVTPNGVHNDVEVSIIPTNVARPGFDAKYSIIYKNKGNQVSDGSLSFSFDDAKMDLVSATPVNTSSATNSVSWNYTALNPFETRTIDVVLNINSPMEITAVNDGDVLNYTATIEGATDEMPSDNTMTLNQTVVNSLDPNDKTCLEGNSITPSIVGNYVHYVIRFENTGTFPAENIVVTDIIDLTKLDIETLIPQSGSHSFVTRINSTTGKVEFIFENINLPFDDANNDGYIAFKIKTKPTLLLGDTFTNSANIYFDYNFPIVTNTASTTVAILGMQDFNFESYFTLYPTPAKEVLNINKKGSIGVTSIEIYNMLGQKVLAYTNSENISALDVSQLKTGTYFIKLNSDKGTVAQQFVKE